MTISSQNNRALSIIVADDVEEIARMMSDYLSACGHSVTTVFSLADLRIVWPSLHADVVILDISFADGDGRDVAASLGIQEASGLIYVTTKIEQNDRIRALDEGADDYIAKPINLRELAARVRSVARRRAGAYALRANPRVPVGPFQINLINRSVEGKGQAPVQLTTGEFAALMCLVSKSGTPCSRAEMAEAISTGLTAPPGGRTVDVVVMRLRQKLSCFPASFPEIMAVRNIGYILRE